MTRVTVLILLSLGPASVSLPAAARIDPRLASLRNAWIEPVDELGDDRLVAACLADRIEAATPMTRAATKADADVILRVKAHLTRAGARVMLGSMGGTPSAHLDAMLPGGTMLWGDGAKYRRGNGAIGLAADPKCGLANGLLDRLRDAMRSARDK